jgi:hypothetical protein
LETFGADYRISYDPCYDAHHVPRASLDRWAMVLPCKYGEIYPHGQDLLAVELTGVQRSLWSRLDALGCRLHVRGDRVRTYLFEVSLWREVFAVVKPRKRRKATGKQLEALLKHGKANAFRPGHRAVKGDIKPRGRRSEAENVNPVAGDSIR